MESNRRSGKGVLEDMRVYKGSAGVSNQRGGDESYTNTVLIKKIPNIKSHSSITQIMPYQHGVLGTATHSRQVSLTFILLPARASLKSSLEKASWLRAFQSQLACTMMI